MSVTSGLQAPARPAPVPVGDRLLASGRGDLASLLDRFPPRPAEKTWAVTRQPREQLLDRLLSAPFRMEQYPESGQPEGRHYPAPGLAGGPAGRDLAGAVGGQRS